MKLLLRITDLLAPLIRSAGVNYPQFRAILETKLILDTRRRGVMAPTRRDQKPKDNATHIFYALMGLALIGFVLNTPVLLGMTVINSYIMLMILLSLIGDFSTVLLDSSDNAILQPRPVDGRTILVARCVHIVTYLSKLGISLSLVVLIIGAFKIHPLFPLVFLGMLGCAITLTVAFTNVLYLLAARISTQERLREVITYFQLVMMIIFVGSFQILPRLVQTRDFQLLDISKSRWIYAFPPAWMAGPLDLLAGHAGPPQYILTALAIVGPAVCLVLVLTLLGPRFNRLLLDAEAGPAEGERRSQDEPRRRQNTLARFWARRAARTPAEAAVFEMIWCLCRRDRYFKMRAYPAIVFPFLFSIGMLIGQDQGFQEALRGLPHTHKHLFLLYVASAMIAGVLMQLRYSDKYEAAWVYLAMPIATAGEVLMGALKAVVLRFVLPAFALISLPVLVIWGWRALPDLLTAWCALMFIGVLDALLLGRALPFSTGFGASDSSGRFARSMFMMLVPAAIGGAHFAMTFVPWGRPALAAILLGGTWRLGKAYRNTRWSALLESDEPAPPPRPLPVAVHQTAR